MMSSVTCISDIETLPLLKAAGHISDEDVIAHINVPRHAKSAMDGYAVFSEDVKNASHDSPCVLKAVDTIDAGDFSDRHYERGECVRIMTGAFIPDGFDCVVKQEDTDMGAEYVRIYSQVVRYGNYCPVGEDIREGQIIIGKNMPVTPLMVGLAASVGISTLKVRRPLRAAVISTGSELADPCKNLGAGQIYSSIPYILSAAVSRLGLECIAEKNIPDIPDVMEREFRDALLGADVLITTGGLSVGRKDLVRDVLEKMNAEIVFDRKSNPLGNPVLFSLAEGKPVLSLSGNPFAAIANFEYYFMPLVSALMGSDSFMPKTERAEALNDYTKVRQVRRRVRGFCSNGQVSLFSEGKNSTISGLSRCNCFVDVESGDTVRAGDRVQVTYFGGIV